MRAPEGRAHVVVVRSSMGGAPGHFQTASRKIFPTAAVLQLRRSASPILPKPLAKGFAVSGERKLQMSPRNKILRTKHECVINTPNLAQRLSPNNQSIDISVAEGSCHMDSDNSGVPVTASHYADLFITYVISTLQSIDS